MPTQLRPLLGLTVLDTAALVLVRPRFAAVRAGLQAPHAWFARVGTDGALADVAATALWLAAAWIALGLLAAYGCRLPGLTGRWAARAAAIVLPRALVRVLVGAAGMGIVLAPAVAQAGPARGVAPATGAAAFADPAPPSPLPAPVWPSNSGSGIPSAPLPPPRWPSADTPAGTPAPTGSGAASVSPPSGPPVSHPARPFPTRSTPRSTPATHTPPPRTPPATPPHRTEPDGSTPASGSVRVRAGESLWLLAARRLGPGATDAQIAHEWPRWYAANRAAIGADPDLVHPGTVLHAPPASTSEGS